MTGANTSRVVLIVCVVAMQPYPAPAPVQFYPMLLGAARRQLERTPSRPTALPASALTRLDSASRAAREGRFDFAEMELRQALIELTQHGDDGPGRDV